MASGMSPDPDSMVHLQQFTPTYYHDVYPSIDPSNPAFVQKDKVVLIAGATGGLGPVSHIILYSSIPCHQIMTCRLRTDICPGICKCWRERDYFICPQTKPA